MHGTSFAFTTIFTNVFKSAFTDVSRSVFGSTTNRAAANACLPMYLHAIASGYAPKPADSAPAPTGSADHLQPIACTTGAL